MNTYQIWIMPETKEKGSHNKWIEKDLVEGKNRKEVTDKCRSVYKSGSWKVRKI